MDEWEKKKEITKRTQGLVFFQNANFILSQNIETNRFCDGNCMDLTSEYWHILMYIW